MGYLLAYIVRGGDDRGLKMMVMDDASVYG